MSDCTVEESIYRRQNNRREYSWLTPPEGVEMEEERGKSRRFKSYFRRKNGILMKLSGPYEKIS